MVSAQTKTCSTHIKALNDNAEFKLHQTEHTNTVIHTDCYSEVWCSVRNSRRTSLPKYGMTKHHLETSTMKKPCPTWAVEPRLNKNDVYSYLSTISSETQIFNFGYLSSGHTAFMWARMWEPMVIFWSRKGSVNKKVWETLAQRIPLSDANLRLDDL